MQTALSSVGPFPALGAAPSLTRDLGGGCPTPVWRPRPAGMGIERYGTPPRVAPPSHPMQPRHSGAPAHCPALGRRKETHRGGGRRERQQPKPQTCARPRGRAVGQRCSFLTSSPRRAPHPKRSSSPGGQHCEPATSMTPRRGRREGGYGALITTTPRFGAAFGTAALFGAAALFRAVGPGALFHRGCEWAPVTPPPVVSTNGVAGV